MEKVKNNEIVRNLRLQLANLKKEKVQNVNSKQLSELKSTISQLEQEKKTEQQRIEVLKDTGAKQASTIKLKDQKISELEKEINDSGINKQHIIDLQASLEKQESLYNSVLSKLATTEKELDACRLKLLNREEANSDLTKKVEELKISIELKEKENDAHVQLVSEIIDKPVDDGGDGNSAPDNNLNNNGESLHETADTGNGAARGSQADKIKELKQLIRKKDTELRNLRSQMSALEGTLADSNLEISSLKEQTLASKAEADREREINDSLLCTVRRLKAESHIEPISPAPRCALSTLPVDTPQLHNSQGISSFSTPLSNTQYLPVDSYYTVSSQATSPANINRAGNNNSRLHDQGVLFAENESSFREELNTAPIAQREERTLHQDNQPRESFRFEGVNNRSICIKSFKSGKNACPQSCPHAHDLDYAKIHKGICFFEFFQKGSCKRSADECWFTHEIPDQLRGDYQLNYELSQALSKIQVARQQAQKKRFPVNIPMYNQYQGPDNFLPPMQHPSLQGSLPQTYPRSHHPQTNRMQ